MAAAAYSRWVERRMWCLTKRGDSNLDSSHVHSKRLWNSMHNLESQQLALVVPAS